MRWFISPNKNPLVHISSGQLLNQQHFIHQRRKLDTFVIIVCTKGTLYLAQDERRFALTPNQYIILFADHEHYGYRESGAALSYFWCHFTVKRNDYKIIGEREKAALPLTRYSQNYMLPEHGNISTSGRAVLIFRQLLDMARANCYSANLTNYALSLLAMEISQEYIENSRLPQSRKEINPRMEEIIEWIRVNYEQKLSVKKIAGLFHYNPDYLSTVFRKYRGIPLKKYITLARIETAKNYLLNSRKGVKEIAYLAGFTDEKVFMKRFKQFENITPTKYRNAFSRTKLVK